MEAFEDALTPYVESGVTYFSTLITGSSSFDVLEIPAHFTAKTRWPGGRNCTIVTSIAGQREWPLKVLRGEGGDACSIGTEWREFLEDQGIGVGHFIIFEAVDERTLVADVHHPPGLQPAFVKIIRPSHLRIHKLDIPTKFWRRLGSGNFDGFKYKLIGDKSTVRVSSAVTANAAQTQCHFTVGWREFCKENKVKCGDKMTFTQVDTYSFRVMK
ncbi:hypothetical protein M758_5G194900 [Ceratodon purpureus]|nr:hypothetical protein M758_5G194900 [Ceratodon purpureus]